MKTLSTSRSEVERRWHVIDASGRTLGRLATEVARLLRGKHKAMFVPYLDTGDYVVVVNAARVRVSGKKAQDKVYLRHSGYPGGLKSVTLSEMLNSHPTRVIEHAVKGMLPHNSLGRAMYKKLKVYAGPDHPHRAQVSGAPVSEGAG
ncbi:MAG: 50S ribosomal protein L13 [Chloroflexota bacterium]